MALVAGNDSMNSPSKWDEKLWTTQAKFHLLTKVWHSQQQIS